MSTSSQSDIAGTDLPAVVLDTNVFVAAGFNRSSHAAHLVDAVRRGDLRMVWNEASRRETLFILGRIPPLSNFAVDELFRAGTQYSDPTYPEQFSRILDPDDRKFIALAQAAGAILVTRDEHLLGPRDEVGVTIMTAREYWQRYIGPGDE